jgi:hypothetical protein
MFTHRIEIAIRKSQHQKFKHPKHIALSHTSSLPFHIPCQCQMSTTQNPNQIQPIQPKAEKNNANMFANSSNIFDERPKDEILMKLNFVFF